MFFAILAYVVMIIGTLLSIHDVGMNFENMLVCGIDIVIGILFLVVFGVL